MTDGEHLADAWAYQDSTVGLTFLWSGHHTVNVFITGTPVEVDCFTVGDLAKHEATFEEVEQGVAEYVALALTAEE